MVLGDERAASPIVGVSCVAVEALAEALVVAGSALGVGRAGEELADWGATQYVQRVRPAHLVCAALCVSGTGRHGGDLTF